MSNILVADQIQRTFIQGDREIEVLKGASFALNPGEITGLIGPSGSGKSTLLQIVGLLERADGGEVFVEGRPLLKSTDNIRTRTRREKLGFVYQAHHLLPEFSALENVMMPERLNHISPKQAAERSEKLIERVGMQHRLTHRPAQLSGGEQQRIAIARALSNNPSVVLADEPTGNLDPQTAAAVFKMLLEVVREEKVAILVATHNHDLLPMMDRVLKLEEGKIVEENKGQAKSSA